ncbi:MAG: hypothetical protein PUF82_05940 [Lactobacillus equicursoris]|uniref:hypothetical protein n=1 Tax=Lactobacillus equicursoris TaxID=420645 RepID=UPI002430BC89|nr:hypothetical protein [Lactobacillus equicursoris]MDD6407521.1 hypothetical protein [Lactobacillus equicursoris]
MIKSIKLLCVSLLSVIMVTMLMSAQNVGAATKNTVTSIKSNTTSENILTDSEINDLDEYVEVQNNQYVLNIPSNSNFTEQEIKVAKEVIEESNENVKRKKLVIDPVTKEASETSSSSLYMDINYSGVYKIKVLK